MHPTGQPIRREPGQNPIAPGASGGAGGGGGGGGGGSRSGRALFEILVREHADMLTAYLRSLVNSRDGAAVDDLFQETLMVAWRRLDDYDRTRPLGPWLRGIAANLVLEHRRKAPRAGGVGAFVGAVMNCDPEVLEALDRRFDALAKAPGDSFRQRIERLRDCLGKLPDRLREAIDLVYARGLLVREAAQSLGADEEAVKKRIQRARHSLGECLRSHGVGS